MQETSLLGRNRVVALAAIVLVGLPICVGVYTNRGNAYRRTSAVSTTKKSAVIDFDNGQILHNWVPASVYAQTVNSINNYFTGLNAKLTGIHITSKQIDTSNGNFDFSISIQPQQTSHTVSVRVRNFDSTLSTLVVIDGQAQSVQASSTPTANPPSNNLDSFGNYGLSSVQINELTQAFIKFAPNVQDIQATTPNYTFTGGTSTINFIARLDKTTYLGQVTTNNISSVRLILQDSGTRKQVFDSGVIGNQ